jgi:hypothetical protein
VAGALATLPALASFSLGHGLLGLVLFALGAFSWRPKVGIGARGVEIRWLFLRERCKPGELQAILLSTDAARWTCGRRRVLVIERRGRGPWVVFAPERVLNDLAQAACGLGLGVAQACAESP